jgi:naringenin degradation protein FdeH
MAATTRRVVTGHDESGKSVVISDGSPPQHHNMRGPSIGAEFFEMWSEDSAVPVITAAPRREPNDRELTIAPGTGHLVRIIDVYPLKNGGKRTVMHRTKTIDYGVVIEGEIVLILEDTEVTLKQGDLVVQRGTNHAWENRGDRVTRMVFFMIDSDFNAELLATLPKPLDLMR